VPIWQHFLTGLSFYHLKKIKQNKKPLAFLMQGTKKTNSAVPPLFMLKRSIHSRDQ